MTTQKINLARDLVLLFVSKKPVEGIHELATFVLESNFVFVGLSSDRKTVEETIFQAFRDDFVSFEKNNPKNSSARKKNSVSITDKGLIVLRQNPIFKEISENFPFEKEKEK